MQHKRHKDAKAGEGGKSGAKNRRDIEEQSRKAESERALRQVADTSETLGTSSFVRMANRASDHMKARDAEGGDKVELWAVRTGRALSAIAVIVLLVWLVNWLTR